MRTDDAALANLTHAEREVIRLRNGYYGPSYTPDEVRRILRVSLRRVQATEARALRKLARRIVPGAV